MQWLIILPGFLLQIKKEEIDMLGFIQLIGLVILYIWIVMAIFKAIFK